MIVVATIPGATMDYFNLVYEGLAYKNDPYVMEKFAAMQRCCNHSQVCLINMLMRMCLSIHLGMDRAKFVRDKGYPAFMKSVTDEFNAKAPSVETLTPLFAHECHGEEATPLPPGQKMFYTKEKNTKEKK